MVNKPTPIPPTTVELVTPSRVLIVDQSSENREVLRTVLQRHGYEIFEAERDTDGLSLAGKCHPSVLVLDMDTVDPADSTVIEGFEHHARKENTSVVLLGRVPKSGQPPANGDVVTKPYHYGPLIRKIEELLKRSESPPTDTEPATELPTTGIAGAPLPDLNTHIGRDTVG